MQKCVVSTLILFLFLIPIAIANTPSEGNGVGINIDTEDFKPLIWANPDSRIVSHNPADGSEELVERINNYAFEGEQIKWDVLVMDKNGIEKIKDVYATIGSEQGEGNDIQVNCDLADSTSSYIECTDPEPLCEEYTPTQRTYDCTRYVDINGICGGNTPCHSVIQTAVIAASSGEIICIYGGNYDSFQVGKPLTIVSLEPGDTIVVPSSFLTDGIDINNNVTVDGLSIRNASPGIVISSYGSNVTLRNMDIENVGNGNGLYVQNYLSSLEIEDSQISNYWIGIFFSPNIRVEKLRVVGNLLSNNGIAILVQSTLNNVVITNNDIVSNSDGLAAVLSNLTNVYVRCNRINNNEWAGLDFSSTVVSNFIITDSTFINNSYSLTTNGGQMIQGQLTNSIFSLNRYNDIDFSHIAGTTLTSISISGNNFNQGVYFGGSSNFGASDIHINNNYILNGVYNNAPNYVNAENNYWGCSAGPGFPGCSNAVNVDYDPWLDIPENCEIRETLLDPSVFNTVIDEEPVTEFDSDTMAIYNCSFTVEPSNSMHGEYWITSEVEDIDGNKNTFDENEYWDFNPIIALDIMGTIDFGTVRPGTHSYSDTLLVTNDADDGSGVLLDMTISGTDFYDPASSGAKCPLSNRIRLNSGGASPIYPQDGAVDPADDFVRSAQTSCLNGIATGADLATETDFDAFCYYATNGAYQTNNDVQRRDTEGYVGIPYETGSETTRAPIISSGVDGAPGAQVIDLGGKRYFAGNVLTPSADIAITFRLTLPEPCNGDFSEGQIYFWGTAI